MSTPPDILGSPWRTGRRNGHTIYAQLGPEPSDQDPFVGSLNTREAAAEAVRGHNAQLPHEHAWKRCPRCPNAGQPCACAGSPCCEAERREVDSEALGALVRWVWVQWASEQPDPKDSWLTPWGPDLNEGQREVDMRIGVALAAAGVAAERARIAKGAAEIAITLTRPGLGNGPAHDERLQVVLLDDLLGLLGDDEGGERT